MTLHPMDNRSRKAVHEIAHGLGLKSLSKGKGTNRRPTIQKARSSHHCKFSHERVDATLLRYALLPSRTRALQPAKTKGAQDASRPSKRDKSFANVSYRDGEIVGASAPEIEGSNKGRSMLQKMGWSTGSGLGAENNKGLHDPIVQTVKNSRTGLE